MALWEDLGEEGRRRFITPGSLTHEVVRAFWHMRASTRRLLLGGVREGHILFLLLLSDFAFFLSWSIQAIIVPQSQGAGTPLQITGLYVLAFVGRTAAMYVLAMFLGAFCRSVLGGQGDWAETRAAVFWGALVAAPFGIVAAIASICVSFLSLPYPIFSMPWIQYAPYWIGTIPFLWFIAAGVAEVHGFRRTAPVFMCLWLPVVVGLSLASLLHLAGIV